MRKCKDMASPLQRARLVFKPSLPDLLKDLGAVCFSPISDSKDLDGALKELFPNTRHFPCYQLAPGKGKEIPLKIGVVFSGGPAPGGHNVIAALFDTGAKLIGFLDGPSGILENKFKEIVSVDSYRNQGGFDLIGSGRTKIETQEQLEASLTAIAHDLVGLVIIGGDDSNTNAAVLAEYFLQKGGKTRVVGVPKTIDGDLQSEDIEISFGFDSATKTYAEIIGNIAKDAISSKKYYHFIRLMGRSASHVTLECAFLTQPNFAAITEENKTLNTIVDELADLIIKRYEAGKNYGVILLPEGLAELMEEQLKSGRKDPHGNVGVSQIDTEKVLVDLVRKQLEKRNFKGNFNPLTHFLGYEGRSCLPTNFDANYCYALGLCAFVAIRDDLTGVILALQKLEQKVSQWTVKAVPITHLMHMETRLGKQKPVICKYLVDMKGKAYLDFVRLKKSWAMEDQYLCPGPIQFFGSGELTDAAPNIVSRR
jgi:pyrophosphate--fructose-6-phosphate 1-phosphotransferase